MQTTSFSLDELLRRAKDGVLTVPQFQRDFVWRPSQVKLLIDSISRSYPIGSLLLLDEKEELKLKSRSIEAEIRVDSPADGVIESDPKSAADVRSYTLDGQQRTTSIARVFLDAHPTKCYYFDLKLMYENHRHKEDPSWIKERERGLLAQDRKSNNRLLRADIILDQEKADIYVSEYVEDSGDFPDLDKVEKRKAAALIKGVFETMRNYKVPVVSLERESGVESICRVFETINSTGTRLTTFDLAVARFFPDPDLRKLWEDALTEYEVLKTFDIDGERVLQVLYLVEAARSGRYPDPTRSNLLALDGSEITNQWTRSAEALAQTYEWARAYGARPKTLPSHSILVALAAVRSCCLKEDVTAEIWQDHDFMKRWYFSKVMQAGASQASNYRIGQDFEALRRYVETGEQPSVEEVKLDSNAVLNLKPSDVRYKSLQNLFAITIHEDLITGQVINSESELDDHHIFPRNASKRFNLPRNMLDSICNRVPLLATSNRQLGEAYPDDYLVRKLEEAERHGTLEGLRRRMCNAMIPGDPCEHQWRDSFSPDHFEDFSRKRAQLIVERVREVVGDSLRSDLLAEDGDDSSDD
ncbi:MAG: DUF262 domain-containing protein [Deltaproteobacteria bacterium]|nr:DUF262 domain-containing protein [Deltaproteobacteria bacterium]